MMIEQSRFMDRKLFESYFITLFPNPKMSAVDKIPQDVKFIDFNFSRIIDWRSFSKLYAYLKREKIDAIVTGLFDANLLGRLAAILARVPVILSYEHNIYEDKKKWQILSDQFLALFTKKILVGSTEVLEFTSKQEHLPKSKFKINFNSIPLKFGEVKKSRNEVLLKYGLPENYLYIVTAGSLTVQKGHTYLIDAAHQIKMEGVTGFKVLIFGNGSLKEKLSDQIKELGLVEEVKLMGFAPTEDIMALGDIFTLPSLWEGLSIALLEAMDAKCPIVATKVSGTNEVIVDGESGLLVDSRDAHQLSEAFQRLISDTVLKQRLAMRAHEVVKKFSIEKNVKVIENLIIEA